MTRAELRSDEEPAPRGVWTDGETVLIEDRVLARGLEPAQAAQLVHWARLRVDRGDGPDTVTRLARGSEDRTEASGELSAVADGSASVLELPISELEDRLDTGALDGVLDSLIEAEAAGVAGSTRKGALAALASRRELVTFDLLLDRPLEGSGTIEAGLATGAFDERLSALADRERSGRQREEVLEMIATRQEWVDVRSVLDGTVDELDAALEDGKLDAWIEPLIDAETAGKNRVTAIELLESARDD